jgi:hypothetical protein
LINTNYPAVGAGWGAPTEDTFFTTSMTHQLHCLFMMSRIYASLTANMPEKLMSDYHSHYLHCVDYLRQGIMCSADMAMEPHEQTTGPTTAAGAGTTCARTTVTSSIPRG